MNSPIDVIIPGEHKIYDKIAEALYGRYIWVQ